MVFNKASRVVGALATMFIFGGAASAASVGAGQFNLASSVYITNSGFYIGTDATTAGSSANQTAVLFQPATGPFSSLSAGTSFSMKSLSVPPVIPGGSFTLPQFIVLPNGIDVDLTSLPISPAATCTGADSTGCQAVPGSPITLATNNSPTGLLAVNASFLASGVAYYASSPSVTTPISGVFTAQFNTPPDDTIAGLLNDFNTHGFITTSFSATFTTMPTAPVPEPASMALIGAGLFGLGLLGKKKFAK